MKKINLFVVISVATILMSAAVLSQLSPITNIIGKTSQVTPAISLEEKETCTTTFYNEVHKINDYCTSYRNYTSCLNTTGPNTDCSLKQDKTNYSCIIREITFTKNRTDCKANEFIISIDQGSATLKKQIDFSEWGPCIYEARNSCLIVTCQSIYDGANDGQFHGCTSGTSCQRFEICDTSVRTFYKNSRDYFVENDLTFYLNELVITEVPK